VALIALAPVRSIVLSPVASAHTRISTIVDRETPALFKANNVY